MIASYILAVLVVYPDGSGKFPHVQAAVDAALPGDMIAMAPGVFTGQGNQNISVTKPLHFLPLDSHWGASFEPLFSGEPQSIFILAQGSDDCYFEGLGFWNARGPLGAIYIPAGANPTIKSCYFVANSESAIHIDGGSPIIDSCAFEENSAKYGAGIYVESGDARILNCHFVWNSASEEGGAVYLNSGYMRDCQVSLCYAPKGGGLVAGPHAIVEKCSIEGTASVYGGSTVAFGGALLRRCAFYGEALIGPALAIREGEGCVTLEGCYLSNEIPKGSIDTSPIYVETGCVNQGGTAPLALDRKSWGQIKEMYR